MVLSLLGIVAFGQEAPTISEKTTRVGQPPNTSRSGDRVFNFRDRTGTVTEMRAMPSQRKPFEPRRGERVFYFKDRSGSVSEMRPMPSPRKRYEPRRGERVFYFKDRSGAVTETGAMPAQGEVEKK